MPRNSNKIRHTKASYLRALSNNLWGAGQESSSPAFSPRPSVSMSRGMYSESGTPGELNISIASMPLPVIDSRQGSDNELKSDPGITKSKISQPPSHVKTEAPTMADTPKYSMQDLKDRFQDADDSGLILLFEHLERIQLANDELEACEEKERLLVSLKSLLKHDAHSIDLVCESTVGPQDLCREIDKLRKQKESLEVQILEITKSNNEQMSRIRADLELKLKAELESHHQKVGELQKMLCDSEAYRVDMSGQLMKKDNTIKSILAESNKHMSLNSNLGHLLEESRAELVRTREELEITMEHLEFLETESMVEREHTRTLENRLNVMEGKDQIIADLVAKVQTLEDNHHERENDQLQSSMCDINVEQILLDMDHVKEELFKSQKLVGEMRAQANRDHRTICRCNDEIKTCRLMETEIRKTSQNLYLESADKDMQINQMRNKLDSSEEQLSHAYGKVAVLEQELRRLEEFTKLSEEETARIVQERDKYLEAKNNGEQQVKGLTQQIQELLDFLLHKGKVPALIDGVVKLCSICGCIHQLNLIQGPLETAHGAYFEPLHNKLAQQQQDQPSHLMNQHESTT